MILATKLRHYDKVRPAQSVQQQKMCGTELLVFSKTFLEVELLWLSCQIHPHHLIEREFNHTVVPKMEQELAKDAVRGEKSLCAQKKDQPLPQEKSK